jgi:hypothetical protein
MQRETPLYELPDGVDAAEMASGDTAESAPRRTGHSS